MIISYCTYYLYLASIESGSEFSEKRRLFRKNIVRGVLVAFRVLISANRSISLILLLFLLEYTSFGQFGPLLGCGMCDRGCQWSWGTSSGQTQTPDKQTNKQNKQTNKPGQVGSQSVRSATGTHYSKQRRSPISTGWLEVRPFPAVRRSPGPDNRSSGDGDDLGRGQIEGSIDECKIFFKKRHSRVSGYPTQDTTTMDAKLSL